MSILVINMNYYKGKEELFLINIFVGLIFVLFNTNIYFWDIGVMDYITNIIGYILIFFGINELGRDNRSLLKIRPYVIIMIAHSIIFLLVDITGNSPLTMEKSIPTLLGATFIAAGMFMTFIIISELMKDFTSEKNEKNKDQLNILVSIMMLLFILAGISAFISLIPMLTPTIMGALFLLEILFLFRFYYVFISKDEN